MIDFSALLAANINWLVGLLILTALDFILGVVMALVQKRFQWDKLTGYLTSDLVPILGWAVVVVLSEVIKPFTTALPDSSVLILPMGVLATVFLKILASVLSHLSAMGVLKGTLNKVGVSPTGPQG